MTGAEIGLCIVGSALGIILFLIGLRHTFPIFYMHAMAKIFKRHIINRDDYYISIDIDSSDNEIIIKDFIMKKKSLRKIIKHDYDDYREEWERRRLNICGSAYNIFFTYLETEDDISRALDQLDKEINTRLIQKAKNDSKIKKAIALAKAGLVRSDFTIERQRITERVQLPEELEEVVRQVPSSALNEIIHKALVDIRKNGRKDYI